ncbi:MAG: recombination mediator RecR [bacterium]|nr:recombination mediator RecR [bacterium]
MNTHLPDPIRSLALMFRALPGVGPKSALRFVYALLKSPKEKTEQLAAALLSLHDHVKSCTGCGAFTMQSPCSICRDGNRDGSVLCVVAESRDISTFEFTGEYRGRYFVLGGLLSPLDGTTPDKLQGEQLAALIETQQNLKEIILAFNPDMKGEATVLYLTKRLAAYPVRITTLARGLPTGADLEYADEVTLADALRGRRQVANQKQGQSAI